MSSPAVVAKHILDIACRNIEAAPDKISAFNILFEALILIKDRTEITDKELAFIYLNKLESIDSEESLIMGEVLEVIGECRMVNDFDCALPAIELLQREYHFKANPLTLIE